MWCGAIPVYAAMPAGIEWVAEQGWTRAYSRVADVGLGCAHARVPRIRLRMSKIVTKDLSFGAAPGDAYCTILSALGRLFWAGRVTVCALRCGGRMRCRQKGQMPGRKLSRKWCDRHDLSCHACAAAGGTCCTLRPSWPAWRRESMRCTAPCMMCGSTGKLHAEYIGTMSGKLPNFGWAGGHVRKAPIPAQRAAARKKSKKE